MPFVPAICTQCGAKIEVDNTKDAAICQYCGTPFIVEKAINNYIINNTIHVENASINVSGMNTDNLLRRALEFENAGDVAKALDYCNRVLDIDSDNKLAREYIAKLESKKNITIAGVSFSGIVGAELIDLIKQGSKAKAIKIFIEHSGWGLKEAADAISEYELKYCGISPNRKELNPDNDITTPDKFLKQLNEVAAPKTDIGTMIENEIEQHVGTICKNIVYKACTDIKKEIIQKAQAGIYTNNSNNSKKSIFEKFISKKSKGEKTGDDESKIISGEYSIDNFHKLPTTFANLKILGKEYEDKFMECLRKYPGVEVKGDYSVYTPYLLTCKLVSVIKAPIFSIESYKCCLNNNGNKVVQDIQEQLALENIEISFSHFKNKDSYIVLKYFIKL